MNFIVARPNRETRIAVHSLAAFLDRVHHLARGLLVERAGHLQEIVHRGSRGKRIDEAMHEVGCAPLPLRRKAVQVREDELPDGWLYHDEFLLGIG
ncbi:MAG TPA: hypothetical protein VLF66_09840 [Thermoanaerobaculia bacterium]|nr:hypothetical protein [Thermoanaerobaculia bacterium]